MRRRRRPARRSSYRRYKAVAAPLRLTRDVTSASRRSLRQAETRRFDRSRAVSGALVVSIALVGMWVGFDESFYVSAPSVAGHQRVTAAEIVSGSGMAGLHALWANPSAIEAAMLQSLPSLRAARVSCVLPANCAIAVTEREPFLAWRWGQAEVWVDRSGTAFAAPGVSATLPLSGTVGQTAPQRLVVASIDAPGLAPGQRVDPQAMSTMVAATDALPDVRVYRYSLARGLEFDDPNGFPVYLGVGSNVGDRAAVWRALREDLAARGITPTYIDVRFPLAPYYGR